VAIVSTQRGWSLTKKFYVQVARGASRDHLVGGARYGPYTPDELPAAVDQVVAGLLAEGFDESGVGLALDELRSSNPQVSALAALRLGRQGRRDAVDELVSMLPAAGDRLCSILDALGALGDKKAIPALREYSARKLLSKRRSALEALRRIGDEQGVREGVERAVERLPGNLSSAYKALDKTLPVAEAAEQLRQQARALDGKYWGLVADSYYEIGLPASVAAASLLLSEDLDFAQSFHWRYIKSIFKRARLRLDHRTFGFLAHAIEARGRSSYGSTAYVKSGFDGQKRSLGIFRKKTQNYMRRLSWRHLKELANYQAHEYAHGAAEALIHYSTADERHPVGLNGRYSRCYVFHQIFFGHSERFHFDSWKLQFRFRSHKTVKAPKKSELAYPELWDAQPQAWLRVLSAARLPMVHELACREVKAKHGAILADASSKCILAFLGAPYQETVKLGIGELERRFDAQNPDWDLIHQALFHENQAVRRCGAGWLELTAPLWSADGQKILDFLGLADDQIRSTVIEIVIAALPNHEALRADLAEKFLQIFRAPEEHEGAHDAYARVASEALLSELQQQLSLDEVMAWLEGGSGGVKVLAGHLLGAYSGAVEQLGLKGLTALAQNEVQSARQAAHALLLSLLPGLQEDPSVLYILVESQWQDTRELAFDLLKNQIAIEQLGFDGIFGLCDSNREDVQRFGCELLLAHLDEFDPTVVVSRIVEHPHRSMRGFTLDLVTAIEKLIEGAAPLSQLMPFFRAALFDLRPDRNIKDRILQFLMSHGVQSEEQAGQALSLLNDCVFTDVQADFEPILEIMVTLKLKYPGLSTSTLSLVGEGSE
jgi:hypothetical protein